MQKFKSGNITQLKFHNERKNEKYSNQEIDKSQSHLNFSLTDDDRPLRERIESEIKENYTNTRKIQSNAVLLNEFIIGASPEYMDQLSKDEQREYFKTAKQYFDETYGHVVSAYVHLDETNPHMHLGLVPLVEVPEKEYTTLSSKILFDRKELRKIQSEFPKHMQKHGFDVERGEKERQKKYIKNIEDYKKLNHKIISEYLSKIQPDKFVDEIRNKPETFFKNNVKYSKEEHKKILNTIENLNRIVTEKEQLEKDFKSLDHDNQALSLDIKSLKKDIEQYQKEVQTLKREFKIEKKNLKKEFENEKKDLKKDIQKLKGTIKFYQGYFNEFDIKEKMINHVQRATEIKGFNNLIDKEIINQRLNHFNEQLVDDPSLNQDDFLQITVDEVKKYAKDINKTYLEQHSEKFNVTEKDEKITNHYIRKGLFKVLQDHPRVEMHDGYYQILSDNDLIIKEQEKQEREQRQKDYQEFKNMMNENAKYDMNFISKVGKKYLSNKDKVNEDEQKSIAKISQVMESTNQGDITIFTKKDREFYSKVMGREVAFKDLYKFNRRSFRKIIVNSAFDVAFNPKDHKQIKSIVAKYRHLTEQNQKDYILGGEQLDL